MNYKECGKMNQSKSSFIKSLKKNWRYIGKNKFQLILFLILVSIMTLTIVIFPALSSKIILAATDNLLNQVIILGLISFLCGIIYTVTGNLSNKFEQALYIKIVQGIQEEASVETLKLETKEIDKNGFYVRILGWSLPEIYSLHGTIQIFLGRKIL